MAPHDVKASEKPSEGNGARRPIGAVSGAFIAIAPTSGRAPLPVCIFNAPGDGRGIPRALDPVVGSSSEDAE